MIFRLSHALNARVNAGTLGALPLDENPFADWSAHSFAAGRTQYILLSNTLSLYSTVINGKEVTHDGLFAERALGGIRERLGEDGFDAVYQRLVAPAGEPVQFAKALNRAVTGSMNELIHHATSWLVEGSLSPHEVGGKLNDTLLSILARGGPDKYGKPREAFDGLVSRIKP